MYLVFISQHFWEDNFTTQFKVCYLARDIPEARLLARLDYPPFYIPRKGRLVAFFTGRIKEV